MRQYHEYRATWSLEHMHTIGRPTVYELRYQNELMGPMIEEYR